MKIKEHEYFIYMRYYVFNKDRDAYDCIKEEMSFSVELLQSVLNIRQSEWLKQHRKMKLSKGVINNILYEILYDQEEHILSKGILDGRNVFISIQLTEYDMQNSIIEKEVLKRVNEHLKGCEICKKHSLFC